MSLNPVVRTENLSCSFGGVTALEGISISIEAGDYVCVVGPNGSGKSTLVRTLLGLNDPASGVAELFGVSAKYFSDWSRVGYLPQSLKLFNPVFPATVAEIVGLGLLPLKKIPRRLSDLDNKKIFNILKELDIGGISEKLMGELSGGQQQRVLLARALVNNPELLILDEPTSALDPETRERFYSLVDDINRNRGVTVLLLTHDVGTIGLYASKLLYIDKRVLFFGGFEKFRSSSGISTLLGEYSKSSPHHRH